MRQSAHSPQFNYLHQSDSEYMASGINRLVARGHFSISLICLERYCCDVALRNYTFKLRAILDKENNRECPQKYRKRVSFVQIHRSLSKSFESIYGTGQFIEKYVFCPRNYKMNERKFIDLFTV